MRSWLKERNSSMIQTYFNLRLCVQQIIDKLDVPTYEQIKHSIVSDQLSSCTHSAFQKRIQPTERNYYSSPYDEEQISLFQKQQFQQREEVVFKVTVFGQTKKIKETEYIMLGSRTLEPLMQTIDAQCIELDSYKRELMSLTSKQTFFQIEEKIICPKLLIPSLREALDDDYADQVHFDDINSIPLCDIPLKIGQPYLFRHNQCCDHIFLINELRLFDPSRDTLLHDNPVLKIYQSRTVRAHCEICEEDFAIMTVMYDQKVQIEEKRVENAKRITLMCERCYELYGKEEQERGRIQTVKYYREAK